MWGAVIAVAAVSAVTGCSAADNNATPSSGAPSGAPNTREAAATLPPGVIGVSPAGVTTRIKVPAQSTEGEYFQACDTAKVWMQVRPGDRQALVEPYLATIQTPGAAGAGTWNNRLERPDPGAASGGDRRGPSGRQRRVRLTSSPTQTQFGSRLKKVGPDRVADRARQ